MPRPPTAVPFIQTGNPEMDRLQRFVAQALPGKQDKWVKPTLTASWAEFGSGYQGPGFMKDSVGFIHIRGLIKSGTIGSAAFILPTGYRPIAKQNFAVASNGAIGIVEVGTDGAVTPVVGNNAYVQLNGINFDTR